MAPDGRGLGGILGGGGGVGGWAKPSTGGGGGFPSFSVSCLFLFDFIYLFFIFWGVGGVLG